MLLIAFLLLSDPAADTAKPAHPQTVEACPDSRSRYADAAQPNRARRLSEMPPAAHYKLVQRSDGKCVVMQRAIGESRADQR